MLNKNEDSLLWLKKNKKLIIPHRVYEKYNVNTCFKISFTEEGLDKIRLKYKNVRGLPGFIHNLMKGRPTLHRELLIECPNLFMWTDDRSAFIMPSLSVNLTDFKNKPAALKDDPTEGLALVAWAIDSRALDKYHWGQENTISIMESFRKFLLTNEDTNKVSSAYRYFNRTDTQKQIHELEKINTETPYLASILDLTPTHIPFLRHLKESSFAHLEKNFNFDSKVDKVEMYFHFPYPDDTTTLHLHIRVNQGRHPMERARTFPIDEVLECLEKSIDIKTLVLKRKPHYCNNLKILHNIEGVVLEEIKNPFLISSPMIDDITENSNSQFTL